MTETTTPQMPYQVKEVLVGPGEGKPVLATVDTGRYLSDDEVKVVAYVRHLEAQNDSLTVENARLRADIDAALTAPAIAQAQAEKPGKKGK